MQACQHAGAQQHWLASGAVDDGRFNPHVTRATIEYEQGIAQFIVHMRRGGRADPAKTIRTGSGDTGAAGFQQCLRYRMRGAAQANRVLATGCRCGNAWLARQDERQWARPKSGDQSSRKWRHAAGVVEHLLGFSDVHDERMVRWPAFGGKDLCHRRVVGCVCT